MPTKKKQPKHKNQWLWLIIIILFICGIVASVILFLNQPKDEVTLKESTPVTEVTNESTIEYADEEITPIITDKEEITDEETGKGAVEQKIRTVEAVENNGPVTEINDECPEDEECGKGAVYPSIDISSPQSFASAVLGQCVDVDGYYGSQCWDLMSAFWHNYTGRTLTTCGTGAAKGAIADGCWQKNAGNEFTMIWNPAEVQAGDIAFYSTGAWGHTGMAMGTFNNGYFTLLGENQGGDTCPGGGSSANIINLSTRDFIGAFRPNIYIPPEPKPEPQPEPVEDKCKIRTVKKGDTLGAIMMECRGEIEWGESMNDYARHWVSTKINQGNTVFYGWTHGTGYGLFAEDIIKYKE